jgi:hypothetical protein
MGKATIITPAYISVSWTLMISYQFFTETAVNTLLREMVVYWPMIGLWLTRRVDILIFIYGFSWVFVLSSVIPSLILGKDRGMFVQFIVVLAVTLSAVLMQDILIIYTELGMERLFGLARFLENPLDAVSFLFFPYILIVFIDLFGRMKKRAHITEL